MWAFGLLVFGFGLEVLGLNAVGLWGLGVVALGITQRAQYPLIKEYGLNCIGLHIMI